MTVNWPAPTFSLMHTLNHPTIAMIASVAAAACRAAGLTVRNEDLAARVPDSAGMNGPIWRVYPPIARRFGFDGSYVFRTRAGPEGYRYAESFPR